MFWLHQFLLQFYFFLLPTLAVGRVIQLYSKDFNGLMACFVAGIPFFGGTLAGNIFYSIVLFGGFELSKRKFPVLELNNNA